MTIGSKWKKWWCRSTKMEKSSLMSSSSLSRVVTKRKQNWCQLETKMQTMTLISSLTFSKSWPTGNCRPLKTWRSASASIIVSRGERRYYRRYWALPKAPTGNASMNAKELWTTTGNSWKIKWFGCVQLRKNWKKVGRKFQKTSFTWSSLCNKELMPLSATSLNPTLSRNWSMNSKRRSPGAKWHELPPIIDSRFKKKKLL